nr:alanine--tRNA ligase-related protein [Cellulosimicrobium funkei]
MDAQEIRSAYLDFFAARGHAVIERAPLVLREDPTTLFTGAGMQPLMPYLLGVRPHAAGRLLVDSQAVPAVAGHRRGRRPAAHDLLRDAGQLEPRVGRRLPGYGRTCRAWRSPTGARDER